MDPDPVTERRVGSLTVRIDRNLCVGFGDCIDVAPAAFALDDEDVAVFLDTVDGVEREELMEACRACPVDALTVLDPDGRALVP